jgi:hypothetical protein
VRLFVLYKPRKGHDIFTACMHSRFVCLRSPVAHW